MSSGLIESLASFQTVVLEGCDGTGKTTLAAALAGKYGYRVCHCGRTPDTLSLVGRYEAILGSPGVVVLDRSYISELVYGPLDRGGSRLTLAEADELNTRVARRGGVLVHLTGEPHVITARLRARDGLSGASSQRIRVILDAYRAAFSRLDGSAPLFTIDTSRP